MSKIVRAVSPEVAEPPAGTWSNCLVVDGIAYVAGMTAAWERPEATNTTRRR